MMRADPIGMIVSSSGSFLFLSSVFCLPAPFFAYYNRSRLPDHIFFPKTRRKRRRKRRRALEHHHRSVMIRTHRQQCGSSRRCCLLTSSSLSLSHHSSFKNQIKTLLSQNQRNDKNRTKNQRFMPALLPHTMLNPDKNFE